MYTESSHPVLGKDYPENQTTPHVGETMSRPWPARAEGPAQRSGAGAGQYGRSLEKPPGGCPARQGPAETAHGPRLPRSHLSAQAELLEGIR